MEGETEMRERERKTERDRDTQRETDCLIGSIAGHFYSPTTNMPFPIFFTLHLLICP